MNPDPSPHGKPRLQDALLLLGAAAVCSGLFYLAIGEVAEALVYGALTGCGLAAVGVEFVKFIRSYREEHGTGRTGSAVAALVTQAFRIGFVTTFVMIAKELFKLIGVKIFISVVIAASAWFALAGRGWF